MLYPSFVVSTCCIVLSRIINFYRKYLLELRISLFLRYCRIISILSYLYLLILYVYFLFKKIGHIWESLESLYTIYGEEILMDALFTLDNFAVRKWSKLNKKLCKFSSNTTYRDNVHFNHELNLYYQKIVLDNAKNNVNYTLDNSMLKFLYRKVFISFCNIPNLMKV